MAAVTEAFLRTQLEERRKRLEVAVNADGDDSLASLLLEVDSALDRIKHGKFGICEECHDTIEPDRLIADPLVRYCIDHLSAPERRALEDDLQLAARVQRALLPPNDLQIGGWQIHFCYEPAGVVSGDYCDVIAGSRESSDLFLSLGDVSGKGVAASMLMTHLHAMFRSLNSVSIPLDQLLARANHLFCESTTAGQYATLVCGRANASGVVELSSAGHLPVFLLRDGEVRSFAATGLPLGMFCAGEYTLEKMTLTGGDSLVFYTDGLTETFDRANQEFGLKRLAQFLEGRHALAPQELAAVCLNEVKHFSSGAPRKDDRTILILRRA